MRCEKCKKNVAIVRMQQFLNGEKKDLYLCGDCSGDIEMLLILENIFHGFLAKAHKNFHERAEYPKCSKCGITLEELKNDGVLGCAACYASFYNLLEPLLMGAHTSVTHEGKIPKRAGIQLQRKRQISNLRAHMQLAIEEEDFSRAAFLRDQIRRLDALPENVDNKDGNIDKF